MEMHKKLHKPNLFLVGASKTGTTALHQYLSSHPDVFMCSPKEPGYFCKDFNKERYLFHKIKPFFASKKNYLNLFSTSTDYLYYGDATPTYLASKVAAKEIFEFNPDAKIIIGIRDIPSLLYSLYKEHFFNQNEVETNFKKAIELESIRKKGKSLPPSVLFPSKLFYSLETEFTRNISRFLKYFPSEQIHVVIFDNFQKDTKKEYLRILDFLDLTESLPDSFSVVNKNKQRRFPAITRFLANPNTKGKKVLKKIIPLHTQRKIISFLRKIDYSFNRKKSVEKKDDLFLNELHKKYLRETKELNMLLRKRNLIDEDLLELWSYD
jgi:hypothetical protein